MTPTTKLFFHSSIYTPILSEVLAAHHFLESCLAKRHSQSISTQEAFLFSLHHIPLRNKSHSSSNGTNPKLDGQEFAIYLRGFFYGNALQAAAAEGHTEVVEVLISHGANVNADGGIFGTALQGAAAENKVKVVDILLGLQAPHTVDILQRGGAFGSAFGAASREGHADIVQRLREANRG